MGEFPKPHFASPTNFRKNFYSLWIGRIVWSPNGGIRGSNFSLISDEYPFSPYHPWSLPARHQPPPCISIQSSWLVDAPDGSGVMIKFSCFLYLPLSSMIMAGVLSL